MDDTLTRTLLADPARIQNHVLLDLQDRTRGAVTIADPNNAFMTQLDANASMISALFRRQERVFEEIYPVRATTIEQLYRHMTDYDYRDVAASPASATFRLYLSQDELFRRSPLFSDTYRRTIIPDTSVFHLGSRSYGIHYPIDIRINVRTRSILVTHNVETVNPLQTLSSNDIPFFTYNTNGLPVLQIDIPVQQFARTTYTEPVDRNVGFFYTLPHRDKFMAARVFTTLDDGVERELNYTLSEDVYDQTTATVRIKIFREAQKLELSIPQVYVNAGLIGASVRIDIYTTEGAIDVPVTSSEVREMGASFETSDPEISTYASFLNALSDLFVLDTPDRRIVGGSNGVSFADLKRRVVFGSQGIADVPVTPLDLENFVTDNGFQLTKELDTVTHRTFHANRKLFQGDGTPVPVTTGQIQINRKIITDTSSIVEFSDKSLTILPTTVFKYQEQSQTCVALSDTEFQSLSQLAADPDTYVSHLNKESYVRQPFHITIYTADRYPEARSFNLMVPTASRISLISENIYATPNAVLSRADVTHGGNGTGGFTIRFGITKNGFPEDIPETDITVVLYLQDRSQSPVFIIADWVEDTDVLSVYHATILTNYKITADGWIRATLNTTLTQEVDTDIPLETKADLHILVDGKHVVPEARQILTPANLSAQFGALTELTHQSLVLTFGTDLSSAVFNRTNVVWDPPTYATYAASEFQVYENDVYARDNDGVPVVTVTPGATKDDPSTIAFTVEHEAGDPVLDEHGNPVPVIQGGFPIVEGERRRNADGSFVLLRDRERQFFVTSLMLDGRIYASDDTVSQAFLRDFPGEFNAYISSISRVQNQLIEITDLFLRPVKTIGTARFSTGDETIVTRDLGFAFEIAFHVTRAVDASESLKNTIRETTRQIVQSHISKDIISVAAITKDLQETLGDQIHSVDLVGIQGPDGRLSTTQTLIPKDKETSPIVSLKLIKNPDGSLSLVQDVEIKFSIAE